MDITQYLTPELIELAKQVKSSQDAMLELGEVLRVGVAYNFDDTINFFDMGGIMSCYTEILVQLQMALREAQRLRAEEQVEPVHKVLNNLINEITGAIEIIERSIQSTSTQS